MRPSRSRATARLANSPCSRTTNRSWEILTSDTTAPAAALLAWLRCRWRIENAFKYLTAHHGIDWLCDYHADIAPDTTMITNPARVAARERLATAEAELADAGRAQSDPGRYAVCSASRKVVITLSYGHADKLAGSAAGTPAAGNTPPIDPALYRREDVRRVLAGATSPRCTGSSGPPGPPNVGLRS